MLELTGSFRLIRYQALHQLVHRASTVDVGEWQSLDISDRHEMVTKELMNVSFTIHPLATVEGLQEQIEPNLPWAEDHFQERVSGVPLNPPPSEAYWPFNRHKSNDQFKAAQQFSHTYPERMWPKWANELDEQGMPREGIRFEYGDLQDVVNLLERSLLTRQAYLPIWFPEDTGAVHGERVPCTLGYHFLVRRSQVFIVYYIRSCDVMRHFVDDVYMAARLQQWMAQQLGLTVGNLTMHITSLHCFVGDLPMMRRMLETNT